MNENTTTVYHICRLRDVYNYEEGYIGVTKNIFKRYRGHVGSKNNPHLSSALRKYSDIIMYPIFKGTEELCLELEETLRPSKNIGWDIAIGGGKPPSPKGSRKGFRHSEETKQLISEISRKYSVMSSERMKGEGNPQYGKVGKTNPNYVGIYTTPAGVFESAYAAAVANNVSRETVRRRCIKGGVVRRCREVPKDYLGKTWKELGWSFDNQ